MTNTPKLDELRGILAEDGFSLEITREGERTNATIAPTNPDACADCIVPETVMRMYLEPALGVSGPNLSITYPDATAPEPSA